MSRLALYLLGTPRLELDDVSIGIDRRKVLGLLAYLALTQDTYRRDHLAALFWPDYDQTSARANLRRTLSLLNQIVTGDWLQTDRENVSLKRSDDIWLDVDRFHKHLASCNTHDHPASEVCPDCLEPLSQAVALYRDDLLTGFSLPDSPEFDDWQLFQTESLRRELAEALEKLVRGHGAQGEFEPAIGFARRWLALDPLQETAHRQLMRLLTVNDERNAALSQYETCRQILADELGVEPTVETTRLYEQIRAGKLSRDASALTDRRKDFFAGSWPSPAAVPRHNLPDQQTSFIGRAEEVAEIIRLICDELTCRLLTLVGSGGIGKTRLALQAATEATESFPDGVFFVPLAPLNSAESLISTIADALRFALSGINPKEQLLNTLREKELLLLLDNFEQLIPTGGTDLLSEIIATAPGVKLLVTSRERLNLQPEWGIEVRGLNIPDVNQEDPNIVESYDAVQLYLQRARQAQPGFALSSENIPDIVRICHMVEGMPLGLELAAAWLRMMSCREIAEEIERNLDILTTPLRDVPERHQSLRAVFVHSWQLLSGEEQAVFRKLSVFRGGFRRQAAERVAGASLAMLSALLDKSLLRRTRDGRYQIHELLRQYAHKKLSAVSGESEQARDRHSQYYLTYLQQRTNDLKGRQEKRASKEIITEIDNVREAWRWAIVQRNAPALGKAADALILFSDFQSWFIEGETTFRQAVESLTEAHVGLGEVSNNLLAKLLTGQGVFTLRLGSLAQGQELLQQSVLLLRRAEDNFPGDIAFSLFWLGHTYLFQGEYAEGAQYFQESMNHFKMTNDRWGVGVALALLGHTVSWQGEYAKANQLLLQSSEILKQLGERRFISFNIDFLGRTARVLGEYEQAEKFLEESLQMRRELNTPFGIGYSMRELGYLAMALGNYQQAKKRMQESLTTFEEIGARTHLIFPLDGLGSIARLQGEYQLAKQLHQDSLAIAEEVGEGRGIATTLGNLGRLAYDMADYPKAEKFLQESLTRYRDIGHRHGVAIALCYLGYAVRALGGDGYEEARQHFQQSLSIAMAIGARPVALNVLVGLATLLSISESGDADRERAIELLTLVLHHPASEQETKDRAEQLLAELSSGLLPESVVAAQERSKGRELDLVLAEFFESPG